jgi:glutathione S-transferase
MELFYAPGACSLAPHIVAREAGLPVKLVKVDLAKKKTQSGEDYLAINAKGYVPAIRESGGEVMTEVANLVQYLADKKPASGLAPAFGTPERYKLMEWLTFISSELHKTFSWLFYPTTPEATKAAVNAKLAQRFAWLDQELEGRDYLMGKSFTAADAYAFTILNWAGMLKIDLDRYANIKAFMARVAARPKVQEALEAEGLLAPKAAAA